MGQFLCNVAKYYIRCPIGLTGIVSVSLHIPSSLDTAKNVLLKCEGAINALKGAAVLKV